MCRMHTVPIIDVCHSIHSKWYHAAISSPLVFASGFGQSSLEPYDLSSDDEEYLTPNNVAEATTGRCDRAARLLAAARLYFNSPPESPKTGVKLIQITLITTPTKCRLAVHFETGHNGLVATSGGNALNVH
jgi:hypothetical protein